ncbi:hypothetical protein [Virgisporangium aurantiacum]|uniref:Uncharacterized protein n=1 Tax=Virgisporangium aurantiacum TaxID=175570 RepID=A0A8J4DY49_9ACTN|nr:hypothetical protein [Virgisporangium aurantiacum]GIJ54073.1 hypothetical protein Vau01_015890 [Virgisporangium aurantiacum]
MSLAHLRGRAGAGCIADRIADKADEQWIGVGQTVKFAGLAVSRNALGLLSVVLRAIPALDMMIESRDGGSQDTIQIDAAPTAVAPSGTPSSTHVTLPGTVDPLTGIDTGVRISAGGTVRFEASGRVGYGYEGAPDCAGYPQTEPDGHRWLGAHRCTSKQDANAPLPNAPVGALIARIGSGQWFLVGSTRAVTAESAGTIVLGYNDQYTPDNTGTYNVTVLIGP